MSDITHLQQMIHGLQNQLALVSSMATTMAGTPVAVPPSSQQNTSVAPILTTLHERATQLPSQDELSAYVRSLVKNEMGTQQRQSVDITPQPEQPMALPEPTPSPTPAIAPPQGMFWDTLRPIMASVYTQDQQIWLSQPSNLVGLPGFLRTPEGRSILTKTLEDYQRFMGVL